MAKLTAKKRKALPKKVFGLPDEEKYPMPDKSHAANAKGRATQMVKKGKLSKADEKKIDAKANRILYGTSSEPKNSKKKSKRKSKTPNSDAVNRYIQKSY